MSENKNKWDNKVGKYVAVKFSSRIVDFIYYFFIERELEPYFIVLVEEVNPSAKKIKLRHNGKYNSKWYSLSWYEIIEKTIDERKKLEILAEDYVGNVPQVDINILDINELKYILKYSHSQIQEAQNYPGLVLTAIFFTLFAFLINPNIPESKTNIILILFIMFILLVFIIKKSHLRNSRYRKLILKIDAIILKIH